MGEAFLPVDLDKLLDDFEEQDSIASAIHSQQPSSTMNGINSQVMSSMGLLTANMHLSSKINHGDISSSNERQRTTSKDGMKFQQELHAENIQIVPSANVLIDNGNEPTMNEAGLEHNKKDGIDISEQGNTSTVTADCNLADPGTVEGDGMSDLIVFPTEDASCENRTLNEETTSSVPSTRTDEISSLMFTQDHFSNINLAGQMMGLQIMDNSNSTVVEGGESNHVSSSNEADGDSEQQDGSHEPSSHVIPSAQGAVAEVSALPVRNNHGIVVPDEVFQLGYSPPQWVPDRAVNRCVGCHCKFTLVKRRHHCRACGEVFCSSCCNLKFNLQYLEDKLARVCQTCANALLQRQATLASRDASVSSDDHSAMYECLSPQQYEAAAPQPVEPSMANGETTTEDDPLDFVSSHTTSDDIRSVSAQGDVAVTDDSSQIPPCETIRCSSSSSVSSADIPTVLSTVPLPPLLIKTEEGLKVDNAPNHQDLFYRLKKRKETVTFLLNKNLIIKVKIVKLSCCVKRKCWCFSSEGMGAADQEDMVILLECSPKESSIPQDVLSHFNTAFAYAKQGHRVTDLGYTIFGQPFLGSLRNAGFLYVKSSFQCLENLILPTGPHIFGILIQREEVSWVQLFPIRLILRLGAEYRYYPCPLWSVRDREPLYGEIGHTIMNLLADFKNFQYTLPRVTGMHVHLEDKRTVIQLPQNRYDEVVKVLNATDEYVMAFEATFSNVADSHLVCIQDGGEYKTQAINIEGQERKVTGASFIVFNGAMKTTNDLKAKVSIIEDGVMVQMVMQLSQEMRQAMREMRDVTIQTGSGSDVGSVQEVVLEWVTKRNPEIESVFSPIDGLALGTTSDIKINTHFDYSTPTVYRLRWSQLFFINHTGERPRNLSPHFKQSTADVARACTVALRSSLMSLVAMGKRRIGLRVNLGPDMVGYIIGSEGTGLPEEMTNELDNELVPAINNAVNPASNAPSSMEFVFNIIEMLN